MTFTDYILVDDEEIKRTTTIPITTSFPYIIKEYRYMGDAWGFILTSTKEVSWNEYWVDREVLNLSTYELLF